MNWWDYPVGRAHDPTDNANGGELGIDLSTPNNTVITTPWDATVTYVGDSNSTGWIVKTLTDIPGVGPVYDYFLHLNSVSVSPGQHLSAGARVGLSGGLQPGAGGWAHVEFGMFRSSAYATRYWGFVTGSTLDPTPTIEMLRRGGQIVIPTGWTDSANGDLANVNAHLASPNGHYATKGFRHFMLTFPGGWPADDWVLAEEEALDPLEESNPSLGAGTRICCRVTVLGWTPAKNVYVMWVGQELLHLRP